MTGAEFSEVDVDLLADYVGGALTGTPDEARVAALIAGDPEWRAAHDDLAGAMAAVGAELNALGAVAEPMPAELARRLDAAFASAVSDPAPTAPSPAAARPDLASGRHLVAVPDGGFDRRSGPGARRRRLRWAVPIAAAAGVIAFLGVGINYWNGQSQSDQATSSSAAGVGSGDARSAAAAPKMAPDHALAGLVPVQVISSGRDYQKSTLSTAGTSASQSEVASPPEANGLLGRLAPGGALAACLQAIAQQNAGGEISMVQSVDYARYEGAPALIVRFTAANGQWVWATGPDCGSTSAGAARLGAVKVG